MPANSELGDKTKEGIATFPEDLQAAVVLRDVAGPSNFEAAKILDATISSLKSRLHRGRVMFRQHMGDFLKVRG